MSNIVYIKKVEDFNDILLKDKNYKIPLFFKKVIYSFKNIFNMITKKKLENENIWILPYKDKCSKNKINKIFKKLAIYYENRYVIPNDLLDVDIYKILSKHSINYLKSDKIKKYLVIKIIEYINKLQKKEISNIEVTILANEASELNIYLIDKISKLVKNIKIVSKNIYKFKNLEEKLYNEYGIAIQFSNSYKKSLIKSNIIINLDYNKMNINEYEIYDKAIIINCAEENLKIISKLFNGIVINSCNINFSKELKEKFKRMNIYNKYNSLILYESHINEEENFDMIFEKLNQDKVGILNLIGNNGIIDKKEFKKKKGIDKKT